MSKLADMAMAIQELHDAAAAIDDVANWLTRQFSSPDPKEPETEQAHHCLQCGQPIEQNDKRKEKKFCSDACRMAWWNSHRDKVNHRIVRKMECPCCHETFIVYGNGQRKYCSHTCYVKDRFGGGQDGR